MGMRQNGPTEVDLTHTQDLFLAKIRKYKTNQLKIVIFTAIKIRRILHYVNVSVLIKFSRKTSGFTLIIISSP